MVDKMSIDNKMRIIVNYMYENPYCKYSELVKTFAKDISNKMYIESNEMSRKTLNSKIKTLLFFSYINRHGIRKDKDNEDLPDIFTVNKEYLDLFPELLQKENEKDVKEIKELIEKHNDNLLKYDFLITSLMYSEVQINQKGKSRKIYLSNDQYFELIETTVALLIKTFTFNYETWYACQKPEDFDYSITIKPNLLKHPGFYKYFEEFIKMNNLPNQKSDFPGAYAKAKFEEKNRRKQIRKLKYELLLGKSTFWPSLFPLSKTPLKALSYLKANIAKDPSDND